jgi:small redox-active disulfide protein 2
MKEIKILGTGCPRCKRTTEVVEEAVKTAGIDANIEKVEDITEIIKYQVMSTPAIVIDGIVVLKGRVPNKEEVIQKLM